MSEIEFTPLPSDRRFLNLTGGKYGRLTVLGYAGRLGHSTGWHCVCTCGTKLVARDHMMKSGRTRSCGCLQAEESSKRSSTHRMSKTPEYKAWQNMFRRCTDESYHDHARYMGRMPSEAFNTFEAFLSEVGMRPGPGFSIDRVDNTLGYVQGNLRWRTTVDQANNKSSNVRMRCSKTGEVFTRAQACRRSGLVYERVASRVNVLGWSISKATDGLYTDL